MILMKFGKTACFIAALALSVHLYVPAFAEDSCATVSAGGSSTDYSSFAEAWHSAVEAGNSGEVTFTLNKDWTANESGSLGSGSGFSNGALSYSGRNNLTIDLNGCAIDRNLFKPIENGAVIYVNSVLTVVDSKSGEYTVSDLFKGGAIQNGANTGRGGGVVVADNATFNFNGGTILNCVSTDDGGGISITGSGAKLNVNGGSFYGGRTYDASSECCGGAIYSSKASVNVNNAVFEGNYAEDSGGAIYATDGSVTVTDSTFRSNSSIEEGGAIYTTGSITTTLSNCLFSYNFSSDDDGGAVYLNSNTGSYLNDCRMLFNNADDNGGALYVNADKVFVSGGEYRCNTAGGHGGGIYVDSLYDLNASGKLIVKDNTVNGNENDLCLQNGEASTAYLYCGGFYEGSSVWLCSSSSSARLAIKGIDKFQYRNYIRYDMGFAEYKTVSSETNSDGIRAMASVFGDGNLIFICATVILISAAAAAAVAIEKKKGAIKNG